MAIKPIEWEDLSQVERAALAAAGEASPLAFTAVWFNVTQGESFRTNWHHHYFDWAARKMISGECQNVIVNIPPGGTKTEYWSVHLPVYCMAKFNRVRILNTSYSKDLVNENSERSRSLVASAEFQEFYPFEFGKKKVDDWTLEKNEKRKHQLFSRSSGGQITGVRGGYMSDGFTGYVMADDWSKPDSMFSELKRSRSNTLLTNTLRSRRAVAERTPFIMVQQRLHMEDATGYVLSGGMGIAVDLHIKIPAMIDQDYIDALPDGIRERCIRDVCHTDQIDGKWSYWPAKESVRDLNELKKAHPYTYASQYDQAPEKLDGGIFRADDFQYYGDVDEGADLPMPDKFEYRLITVDTAQKTNEWNDWTVFAEWGVYKAHIYRLAYQRARMDAKALRRNFESFVRASWGKNKASGVLRHVLVEDKSSGTGLIQEVDGRLPIKVTAMPRSNDKLTRAMDVQAFHADKRVVLPYGDDQNYEMVSEVASFKHDDSHKFDDQTDVMIDALNKALVMTSDSYSWSGFS